MGKTVKTRLIELDHKQAWLIGEVRAYTGLYFDSSYMHKILTGENRNRKIIEAICHILDIPQDDCTKKMEGSTDGEGHEGAEQPVL